MVSLIASVRTGILVTGYSSLLLLVTLPSVLLMASVILVLLTYISSILSCTSMVCTVPNHRHMRLFCLLNLSTLA